MKTEIKKGMANGRQRGMTVIATIIILCMVGFVLLLSFKIVPIYLDYFNARRAIEGIRTDMTLNNSGADVRRSLERRWAIDYINAVDYKKLKVYKKGGKLLIDLKYEDRRPLIANMDVVANFNDVIQIAP